MEMEAENQPGVGQNESIKHNDLKNKNIVNLVKNNFEKMKYMLDCGFNLLIYGVGSKIDIINLFVQKKLQKKMVFWFNGFNDHLKSNFKTLVNEIIKYFKDGIFKG